MCRVPRLLPLQGADDDDDEDDDNDDNDDDFPRCFSKGFWVRFQSETEQQ